MLDSDRIEIAHKNFKKDLKEGYIQKISPDANLIRALEDNANESLSVANPLFKEDVSSMWVIVKGKKICFRTRKGFIRTLKSSQNFK